MIVIKHSGNFDNMEKFLNRSRHLQIQGILNKYGKLGVDALAKATPVDTGKTASSWSYETHISKGSFTITWNNSNVNQGVPIAIILQYGHGTRNGGYVQGRDYINPAIRPIFDAIVNDIWKEVTVN